LIARQHSQAHEHIRRHDLTNENVAITNPDFYDFEMRVLVQQTRLFRLENLHPMQREMQSSSAHDD
jgi:hypothetical protein